jgi:hypothetical protein
MRAAQFLAIIGRGSKGSNALENTEDRAGATSEQQDNVINTVNSLDPYGPSWQLVPGNVAAGTVYAQVPTSGTGDLDFTRGSTKTRTDASGNVVAVASGVAAIDYRNADGSLSSTGRLLPEPQRTNLLTFSEQFNDASWIGPGRTITPNSAISPDGYQNADNVEITSFSASVPTLTKSSVNVTAQTTYTLSFYAKSNDLSELNLAIYNLNTATFILINQVRAITSDWSRVILTFTTPVGCTSIRPFIIYGATSLGSFDLWGAQLEVGAYASSYIPTTTAAVTRLADNAQKTGVSSLIGQTEGTLFAEVDLSTQTTTGLFRRILMISEGDENTSTYIRVTNDNTIQFVSFNVGLQAIISTAANQSGIIKVAGAYKENDFVLYVNGVQIGTDTAGTIPATRSVIRVGQSDALVATHNLNDRVTQAALFPTRLTNAQLAEITTL